MQDQQADLAFVGGRVRTPAGLSGFAQAIAVSGGVITALGSNEEIQELAGPATRTVDLRGRLVLPAFGDAHIHPVSGGLESLRCNLLGLRSRQECLAAIAEHAAGLTPDAWVLGGGWAMEAFPGGLPAAADLDAVTGGRPAFLPNREHHSAWVNTAALERAGISRGTPDPRAIPRWLASPRGSLSSITRTAPPARCCPACGPISWCSTRISAPLRRPPSVTRPWP